jgi:hypothetical protein
MVKRVCVFVLLVATVACGNNLAAPTLSAPAGLAGNWSGTWQATLANGGAYSEALTMTLTQAGSAVSGTWSTSDTNGTVSGTATSSAFSGTFTWNATSTTGTSCTGTLPVSGSAGGSAMSWTSAAVTGNCTNLPTAITMALQSH